MIDLLDRPAAVGRVQHGPSGGAIAQHVAGLGAPAVALSYLVHATGGRDLRPLCVTVALIGAALVVLRADRLPRLALVVAASVAGAGLAVALVHVPSHGDVIGHFYRWRSAGGYAVAAGLVLSCLAYGTTQRRRTALSLVVCGATVLQFAWAFVPWWAGGESGSTMVGTIYWYNQYAVFLYPGAVIGLAVALRNLRTWRFLGWTAAALGPAGVVYSTSRAVLAVTVASYAATIAFAVLRSPGHRRRTGLLAAGVVAAAVAVVFCMSHPPLVKHSTSPFASEQRRTGQNQSLATNGGYRLQFWHQAVVVAVHNPLAGAGFGELASAAKAEHDSAHNGASTPLAHNGVLQPFADGGLLLGLPVLAGLVLLVSAAVRRVARLWRRGDVISAAALVAAAGSVGHSIVDFDWSYPAVFAVSAICLALAATAGDSRG